MTGQVQIKYGRTTSLWRLVATSGRLASRAFAGSMIRPALQTAAAQNKIESCLIWLQMQPYVCCISSLPCVFKSTHTFPEKGSGGNASYAKLVRRMFPPSVLMSLAVRTLTKSTLLWRPADHEPFISHMHECHLHFSADANGIS